MRDDGPRCVAISHLVLDDVTITNCLWQPHPEISGYPETGVRVGDKFRLIQHGWWHVGIATVIIVNRLRRGWSVDRIARFMTKRLYFRLARRVLRP